MTSRTMLLSLLLIAPSGASTPLVVEAEADATAAGFTQHSSAFGVSVYATAATPIEAVQHATTILAEYLDDNADGVADDAAVVASLVGANASMLVFATDAESESWRWDDTDGFYSHRALQDLYASESKCEGCCEGCEDLSFDWALEEVLHLISDHGYAVVYPGDFSTSSRVVSTLASSILEVIGDCETSFSCDSRRRLEHDDETALLSDYSYSYSYALPNCADYSDERWIEDSCTGDYHYADATCDYACLLTEGLYWALTSHLGAQAGRCDDIADEWELCTDALIQANAPMLAQLLNHSTLPTVIPDGDYDWDTYYAVHTDDAIDYVCADSETWHKKGDTNKGCAWVAALPESRCTVKDEFAVYGFERCSETCGACGVACVDSETWYKKGEPSKNCDWVSRYPVRATVVGDDDSLGYEACPRASFKCEPYLNADTCTDSASWYKKDDTSKDCTWVAGFPESRCTVKNEFVVFAFEECRAACSTCTSACEDSTSWFKKGEPDKDCTWASRFANRFYVVGDDDTMAYESCHYAARSCDF